MSSFTKYRRFVDLRNGKRVMLRCLNGNDRDGLLQLFQDAPDDAVRLLKQDVRNVELVNSWVENLDYHDVLPLVAVDLDTNYLVAQAVLHRGIYSSRHVGEVRIFVSHHFHGLGLGGHMLDELIGLARKLDFQILRAEVLMDHKSSLKAFRSRGFENMCALPDFFLTKDGETHDVVLMVLSMIRKEDMEF